MTASSAVEAWVSLGRIVDFLNSDQLQSDAVQINTLEQVRDGEMVVRVTNGDFCWKKDDDTLPTLQGIDLEVRKGDFLAIIGGVGVSEEGRSWYSSRSNVPICRAESRH
jgi:ATP-binding cassette, subfamily C (CFTR/MRP), member 1